MPERGIAIVRFVFILVRADSLQYKKLLCPSVALQLFGSCLF